MAFPSIASSGSNNSGANITGGQSWSFSFGFTATLGRMLVLAVANDGSTTVTATGFTEIITGANSTNVRLTVLKKLAAGGETSVNITPVATESISAAIWEISGSAGFTYVEGETVATGASVNPDSPSFDPSWGTEDTLWLSVYGWDANQAHTSYPTNYTLGQQTSRYANTQGCGIAGAGRQVNAASENPGTATIGSEDWCATTIAVRPAIVLGAGHYQFMRPLLGGLRR